MSDEKVQAAVEQLLDECPPDKTDEQTFWGRQFDLGLAWVSFPEGKGGLDVAPAEQVFVDKRLRDAGASFRNRAINVIGLGMAAGTLLAHADEATQQRMLRPIFTLEEIWCQLFSEPGAGSDLAGLATTAIKDGDTWVINGQKVWTTLAHIARWGLLVTRTDPDLPKHRGLTYFICDMEAEGVDVRPLYQITGEAEFNEVYFTDVHLDDSLRLGDVGAGWSVSMTTLMNERVAIGGSVGDRGSGFIAQAVEAYREGPDDGVALDRLMALWIEAEALRLTSARAAANRQSGTPGPEGSTAKLHWADLNQRITSFTMDLLGPEGMLHPHGYEFSRPNESGIFQASPSKAFLRSRAMSIEGGTSEIMKNILGEHVLGLPGEPRVDKDVAWRDVPRS